MPRLHAGGDSEARTPPSGAWFGLRTILSVRHSFAHYVRSVTRRSKRDAMTPGAARLYTRHTPSPAARCFSCSGKGLDSTESSRPTPPASDDSTPALQLGVANLPDRAQSSRPFVSAQSWNQLNPGSLSAHPRRAAATEKETALGMRSRQLFGQGPPTCRASARIRTAVVSPLAPMSSGGRNLTRNLGRQNDRFPHF